MFPHFCIKLEGNALSLPHVGFVNISLNETFIRFRMMNTSKLASFRNFKSVISNFKYLGACPEDCLFTVSGNDRALHSTKSNDARV